MPIDYNSLVKIGLRTKEAKIYLASLELGETTIIPLSKYAGISRTTAYVVTEKMAAKGFLSITRRGAHNYISPAPPEKLREFVIIKEQKAKNQREIAEEIIPSLLYLSSEMPNRPKVQYFSGRAGLRAIHEDLLSSGEVKDYYIGSTQEIEKTLGKRFIIDWIRRRIKAGIFSYGIRIKSQEIKEDIYKTSRRMLREIRYAPEGFESPLYTIIYGNKVAFLTSKNEGFGLIIESEDFGKTQKSMFDILWKVSKKSK